MRRTLTLRGICLLLLTTLLVFTVPVFAHALGLSLGPSKIELVVHPNMTKITSVKLLNQSDIALDFTVSLKDFSKERSGSIIMSKPTDGPESATSWIRVREKNFHIPPKSAKEIDLEVSVPSNAEPGTHRSLIIFCGSPQRQTGAVKLIPEIGAMVLVTVPGKIVRKADFKEFNVPTLSERTPVLFRSTVVNDGNVHLNATGKIVISTRDGKRLATIPLVSRQGVTVLPKSELDIKTEWKEAPRWGRFRALATIDLGLSEPFTKTYDFTIFPIGPAKTASIVLGIIILAFVTLVIAKRVRRCRASSGSV